jgi:proline iminopeptidase
MSTGVIIAIVVVLVALVSAAFLLFRRMMEQPLYKPGMVRAGKNLRAPLDPPPQTDDPDFWIMQEDIELYQFSAGKGRDVLVMHGGPGYPYRQPWTGLEMLTADYRFHYYDQRGCGRSSRPIDSLVANNNYKNIQMLDETLGIGAQLADVERIRRILRKESGEEHLILIGHSFGAFLAALYAAEFQEQVRAMVLVAPADMILMPPAHGGLLEDLKERLPDEMQEPYAAYLDEYFNFKDILTKSEDDLISLNSRMADFYRAAYDLPVGESEQGEPGGWMVQAQYFSLGKKHDYGDALRVVDVPALVIHGADDLQTEAVGQMYVDTLANARLEVIPKAGHFPYEEQPEAFYSAVCDFLNEHT